MGTISDKLMRIINTKEDIRQALISKGYDVPTSIPFKEYAKMILDLPCNADSFPDIEGIVARYSASGLTNEEMSKNPVWKDLMGNGHDLQMKNFGWGGMSGVGGYKYNFLSNDWSVDVNQTSVALSHKIVIINKRTSIQLIKSIRNELENTINITLKVTGLEANGSSFKIYDNVGSSHAQRYNKDGIYQINYTATEGANRIFFYAHGGNMGQLENPITIEQLPLYPGALVFDGVDDYGVCDNFPIMTKEKGYTVVALRQWITRGKGALGLVSNVKDWINNGAFLLEYRNIQADHLNKPISFGAIGSENDLPHILTYQTSKSYNSVSITTGNFEGTDVLHVGKLAPTNVGTCINAAIWELVFLDHDATEEELTKIKDYFVKTYPWLFPDQAWTVVGKTNEDEDRATIANITGNGNNLVLSNFGFAENSGYGLYGQNFNKYGYGNLKTITYQKTASSIELNVPAGSSENIYSDSGSSIPIGYVYDFKIKVTGLKEGNLLSITKGTSLDNIAVNINQDGVFTIKEVVEESWDQKRIYFWIRNSNGPETILFIEQIPDYEGYLVTDGVDDKIISSAFTMGKDFTVVGEWELLSSSSENAGLSKPFSFVVYNRTIGLSLFINTGTSGITIENIKSMKAISSNGIIYFDDWQNMNINKEQDIYNSTSPLSVGWSGNSYTKLAFKNFAIYPTVLSKEDCIKAYNYLQTLKAK